MIRTIHMLQPLQSEWFFYVLKNIDEMHLSKKISYIIIQKVYFIDFICILIGVFDNIA